MLQSQPLPMSCIHMSLCVLMELVLSCEKWSWPKPVRPDQFWQPKVVWGQIMATKTGPPRTRFGSQKWSYLAKSGPRGGLVLATKSGPGPGFGSQKWSWEKQFW